MVFQAAFRCCNAAAGKQSADKEKEGLSRWMKQRRGYLKSLTAKGRRS